MGTPGARVRIIGGAPLRGAVDLPPDLPVAHLALVLAALGEGESSIEAPLEGAQLGATLRALTSLGVGFEVTESATRVTGRGLFGLATPTGAIDCGRSPWTLALLAGLMSGQRFGTRLLQEEAPHAPSLEHMLGALRARGAQIAGSGREGEALRPPLSVAPLLSHERLRGIECALPEPDALAKSAILLSGLFAAGPTAVSEPLLSPDHAERMLSTLEVPIQRVGAMAGFDPAGWPARLPALGRFHLPGSVTCAAFASAAASVIAGSRIALRHVGVNPTRTGFLDGLRLLGGRSTLIAKGDCAGREPVADLHVQACQMRGGVVGGELVLRCGEALPALCLLGACAGRGLQICDGDAYAPEAGQAWQELAILLRAFGAQCAVDRAGLSVAPVARLMPARVDVRGDHRLALTAVVFGLAAQGETVVENAQCLEDDCPGLLGVLRQLGARIELERPSSAPVPEPVPRTAP
jgi:3-phosphoshikimate 1-carboxyvinyltransferase